MKITNKWNLIHKKKEYYLYYTYADNLESIPCDEYKDPLKIIYNKNNTIIFCVSEEKEEEEDK